MDVNDDAERTLEAGTAFDVHLRIEKCCDEPYNHHFPDESASTLSSFQRNYSDDASKVNRALVNAMTEFSSEILSGESSSSSNISDDNDSNEKRRPRSNKKRRHPICPCAVLRKVVLLVCHGLASITWRMAISCLNCIAFCGFPKTAIGMVRARSF